MHGRFACPRMEPLDRDNWPDEFHADQSDLMNALHSSRGIQMHVPITMLRQWINEDLGMSHRVWRVRVFMRDIESDTAVSVESMCAVRDDDTADSVAMEFATYVLLNIATFMEGDE